MSGGFKINKQAIADMSRDIQREFDKHPIKVSVEASTPTGHGADVYNGPVIQIHGNNAQIAWGNENVTQSQSEVQQITPGFEQLAQVVATTLQQLPSAGLDDADLGIANDAAKEVLAEVTKEAPDSGLIRRGVALLRGVLAPIALGTEKGAAEGVRDWAKTAVEQLSR